ncbi:DUF3617 family protein [Parvularcula flava]|uniref:DUF3617 family protein n=1 Tax=Aquisalinus luteolus TaxID=1566827 RepID=A0A8J3A1T7_9PROT|nr:DUF3617 family protein [Aquisalinus luteolus]NHK26884.1 DUF3617 family protein [Aquisalinus luteolus]GGH93707.1 hypothetical protein GCM10011355_06180 [Aquisalinus luteolus]
MTKARKATTLTIITALMSTGIIVAHAAQERTTAPEIKPGKWEMTSTMTQSSTTGQTTTNLPEQVNTTTQCVKKDNAVLYPEFFLPMGCSFTGATYTDNSMNVSASCGSAGVTMTGSVSASIRDDGNTITSFTFLSGAINDNNAASMSVSSTATFKGSC